MLSLDGCAGGSFYINDKTADLTRTNLVTTDDSYLVKEYVCLFISHACAPPLGDKTLYFPEYNSVCAPPDISAFQRDPAPWQRVPRKTYRGNCLLYFYTALPKGTKIRIERIDWFWSSDSGRTTYTMRGRLLDPKYKDAEVIISPDYFFLPNQSDDGHFHLVPWFFAKAIH
ncbi:MAG: hypothetical protein WCC11_02960 [Gammaproteobacteria bacterium]